MELRRGGVHRPLHLPPRSLLVLAGEARLAWHHYIPHRRADTVAGRRVPRASRRVSFTFRKVPLFYMRVSIPSMLLLVTVIAQSPTPLMFVLLCLCLCTVAWSWATAQWEERRSRSSRLDGRCYDAVAQLDHAPCGAGHSAVSVACFLICNGGFV